MEKLDYGMIRRCVSELDSISSKILEMKIVLQMSSKDIGLELDMSSKSVDNYIYRAKKKVKKMIEGMVCDDER